MKAPYWLLMVLITLNSSCRSMDAESPTHSECAALFKPFFWLPMKEQLTQFAHFSVDRQYVVYICGNQEVHPPTIYLVDPFAKEGEIAVPFLKKKLIETQRDSSIRDIIYVFSEMQRRKTYDVANDKVLLSLIERRASEIKDKFWREYTEKFAADIKVGTDHNK